jgi:hypothetical protein
VLGTVTDGADGRTYYEFRAPDTVPAAVHAAVYASPAEWAFTPSPCISSDPLLPTLCDAESQAVDVYLSKNPPEVDGCTTDRNYSLASQYQAVPGTYETIDARTNGSRYGKLSYTGVFGVGYTDDASGAALQTKVAMFRLSCASATQPKYKWVSLHKLVTFVCPTWFSAKAASDVPLDQSLAGENLQTAKVCSAYGAAKPYIVGTNRDGKNLGPCVNGACGTTVGP